MSAGDNQLLSCLMIYVSVFSFSLKIFMKMFYKKETFDFYSSYIKKRCRMNGSKLNNLYNIQEGFNYLKKKKKKKKKKKNPVKLISPSYRQYKLFLSL